MMGSPCWILSVASHPSLIHTNSGPSSFLIDLSALTLLPGGASSQRLEPAAASIWLLCSGLFRSWYSSVGPTGQATFSGHFLCHSIWALPSSASHGLRGCLGLLTCFFILQGHTCPKGRHLINGYLLRTDCWDRHAVNMPNDEGWGQIYGWMPRTSQGRSGSEFLLMGGNCVVIYLEKNLILKSIIKSIIALCWI